MEARTESLLTLKLNRLVDRRHKGKERKASSEQPQEILENAKENIEIKNNQNNRHHILRDYSLPAVNGVPSSIQHPTIGAYNFEIKPTIIQMIFANQFSG